VSLLCLGNDLEPTYFGDQGLLESENLQQSLEDIELQRVQDLHEWGCVGREY